MEEINGAWVVNTLQRISAIGRTPAGGAHRLGFSPEDREARALFRELLDEAGLAVRVDAFGNIIARLEGADPAAPAVASGSHLDTVPDGGHYDGVAGCVLALGALKRLQRRGPLTRSLEAIVFEIEESSRFSLSTMGSRVMAGKADPAAMRELRDALGVPLPKVMAAAGFDFEKIPEAARRPGELRAFIEVHIDQGSTLEELDVPLGIVSTIAAAVRFTATVTGRASHAGSTRMNRRRDALMGACDLVRAVRDIADRRPDGEMVGNVGRISVRPGAINVVPGEVELTGELRGTDKAVLEQAFEDLLAAGEGIGRTHGTPVTFRVSERGVPVPMNRELRDLLGDVTDELGIPCATLPSGAGHDSQNMASFAPTAMLFVRSRDGLSHHPLEYASPEDLEKALDVLTETLYRLAR